MKFTGIILAGGKSSRMGKDKGLLEFNGKKLIEYPLSLLGRFCEELIISSDNPAYHQFGFTVVNDDNRGNGPLSGICSAMNQSSGEWSVIVGCDMPFLEFELFEQMLANPLKGIVPVHHNFMEPLASIYHWSLLGFFEKARKEENYSLKSVLPFSGVRFLPVDDLLGKYPLMFYNINSASDLERLESISRDLRE